MKKVVVVRAINTPGRLFTGPESRLSFSPTWEMTKGLSNWRAQQRGQVLKFPAAPVISWEEYAAWYQGRLLFCHRDRGAWGEPKFLRTLYHASVEVGTLELKCLCPVNSKQCHNQLLMEFLLEEYPDLFVPLQGSLF